MNPPTYVIISPAKDEAKFLPKTIASVASQTILPARFVVINDGSTDGTRQLLDDAARQYPWLLPVHLPTGAARKPGRPHIEAFYAGYDLVKDLGWDYLVKLDADVAFEPTYFEACLGRMAKDPQLGIGGGTICHNTNGVLIEEAPGDPAFHVRGATKIYRRACWEAIGGIIRAPGWDSADELKANMLGWKSLTFKDLKLDHLRPHGASYGTWKNWVKNGLANYICGYHPIFMFAKCAKRALATRSPVITAGLGYGFISGYVKRVPRVEPQVIRYVHREQMKCLLFKKSLWSN